MSQLSNELLTNAGYFVAGFLAYFIKRRVVNYRKSSKRYNRKS